MSSDCKVLYLGSKKMTVLKEYALAHYDTADEVIRSGEALFGMTGRNGCVGGLAS